MDIQQNLDAYNQSSHIDYICRVYHVDSKECSLPHLQIRSSGKGTSHCQKQPADFFSYFFYGSFNHVRPFAPQNSLPIRLRKIVRITGIIAIVRSPTFKPHFDGVKVSCQSCLNLIKALSSFHRSAGIRISPLLSVDSCLLYDLEITNL